MGVALTVSAMAAPALAAEDSVCHYLRQKVVWSVVVNRNFGPQDNFDTQDPQTERENNQHNLPWLSLYMASDCSPRELAAALLKAEGIVSKHLIAMR